MKRALRAHAWRLHKSAALAVVLALACSGSDQKPEPSGAPMGGASASKAASGENHAPVIERVRMEPEVPLPGGRVRALVQTSDPDGDSLKLRYAWTLDGEAVGNDSPDLTLERGRKGEELALSVVASDGSTESAPGHARTELGNRPPLLTAVLLEPAEGLLVGGTVKAVPDAKDPDDDRLSYEVEWLVNGRPVDASGLEFETRSLRRDDQIQARVSATDDIATTSPTTSAPLVVGNSAPEIVSRPESRFEGGVFHYAVKARDVDGDRNLRFSLEGAPDGMTIDRLGGEIAWSPKPTQTGHHAVDVVVEDARGAKAVQRFELDIGSEAAKMPLQPPAARAEHGAPSAE